MGSKPKQVDPGVAKSSSAGAEAAAQASAKLSDLNRTEQETLFNKFFGAPGSGQGGTLTNFMDPNSLTAAASDLQGPYKAAWQNVEGKIANNYALQRGALAQSAANRGFAAGMPTGFQEEQNRKLARDEADTRGSTYTSMLGEGYKDALSNFWNAHNIGAGQAASAREGALSGSQTAGNINANLYGTAGQQSQQPSMLGAALGAGGTVGAGLASNAALFCAAKGAKITLADGRRKPVELLTKGDKILQLGGAAATLLETPIPVEQPTILVVTAGHRQARVSLSHTFALEEGGYVYAGRSKERSIAAEDGKDEVVNVLPMEHSLVYPLDLEGNHSYLVDGLWSLT